MPSGVDNGLSSGTLRYGGANEQDWLPLGFDIIAQNVHGLTYREIGRRQGVSYERVRQRAIKVGELLHRDRVAATYLLAVAKYTCSATRESGRR